MEILYPEEAFMFKKLGKKLFAGGSPPAPGGFFLKVRCNVCGEVFNLFINTSTDLGQNFTEGGGMTYSLNKEIVGGYCRNLIQVSMVFDGSKKMISREIENGVFIDD
jgi:hypothetical protein